ncbi:MAG TPA: hypothetical protein DCP69_09310, partial [Candidatus Omnitrophica bacterium]|nr:hypothetical protein [Candidatus Omnitrophota bacterium]
MQRAQTAGGDDDDFARLHVAHKFGADEIQRAGFRGQHVRLVEPPDAQRAESMRVSAADQRAFREEQQRK